MSKDGQTETELGVKQTVFSTMTQKITKRLHQLITFF